MPFVGWPGLQPAARLRARPHRFVSQKSFTLATSSNRSSLVGPRQLVPLSLLGLVPPRFHHHGKRAQGGNAPPEHRPPFRLWREIGGLSPEPPFYSEARAKPALDSKKPGEEKKNLPILAGPRSLSRVLRGFAPAHFFPYGQKTYALDRLLQWGPLMVKRFFSLFPLVFARGAGSLV